MSERFLTAGRQREASNTPFEAYDNPTGELQVQPEVLRMKQLTLVEATTLYEIRNRLTSSANVLSSSQGFILLLRK